MENDIDIEKLKYPIGRFEYGKNYSYQQTLRSIEHLKELPGLLSNIFIIFNKEKLYKTYRKESWTAKQIFNHLFDVYINAYIRTKWLLTESEPVIKPYDENECAKLADSYYENLNESIDGIKLLFNRWLFLLCSLPEESFTKKIYHPEYNIMLSLHELVAMYEWHGYHHLAHLKIISNSTD